MNQKVLAAVVLIVFAVLLAGGVVYVFMTRQTETIVEQRVPGPVVRQPTSSGALNIAPPSTPRGDQTDGWKTYRSDAHELSFKYPPQFPPPSEYQQVSGQYAITVGEMEIQYFSPGRNRVAGFTLHEFTHMPWLHKADDPYKDITVGGARAALYELLVPSYPRSEEVPVRGYAKTLQVGLETPGGGFLEMSANSELFPDEASARKADLSWFHTLLSTVSFAQ